MMAEIPRLSAIKRMACERVPDGLSSARLDMVLRRIESDQRSMRVPGLQGESHEERAASVPLVEYLLTQNPQKIASNPRFREVDDYFLNVPAHKTMNAWDDPAFQRQLDLLVIGSKRIDIIDQYQPLDKLNPVLKHFLRVFSPRGEYKRHLTERPQLWLHLAERPNALPPVLVGPQETVASLLQRMGASPLLESFDVVFAIWKLKEHHSRYVLGDIGGLMLGESLNMPGPISVTSVPDHIDLRRELEEKMKQRRGFVRCIHVAGLRGLPITH